MKNSTKLSALKDLESHNLIIRLNEPGRLTGIYGKEEDFMTLGLFVDEKEEFVRMLEEEVSKNGI